jgi:site-specific recombinase XerD
MPVQQLPLLPSFQGAERQRIDGLTAHSTLHRAAERFHEHMLQQDLSKHTVKAFDSDLRLLSRFLGNRTPVGTIASDKLESFLNYLRYERGVPCKPKSLARRLTTLKVFFAWLAEEGIIQQDPAANLVHQRVRTPLPRVLSKAEITQLLSATDRWRRDPDARDARPHLLVTLLLDTGIKKGECMRIALNDLSTADPSAATVFIRYDSTRRRYKERKLRLSPGFATTLPEYLAQYEPEERLFECTARNLEYVLDECEKRAGLAVRTISFENLRWTCARRDFEAGMDEDTLRRKLGLSHITWAETLEKLQRLSRPAL